MEVSKDHESKETPLEAPNQSSIASAPEMVAKPSLDSEPSPDKKRKKHKGRNGTRSVKSTQQNDRPLRSEKINQIWVKNYTAQALIENRLKIRHLIKDRVHHIDPGAHNGLVDHEKYVKKSIIDAYIS